ncbi:MAG TPA: cache domain-containing protein, partial [Gemmatimonadales bacterium]|nr:cache domain-containing protein [Gemmatimonadales bacterium]
MATPSCLTSGASGVAAGTLEERYEHADTREVVALVNEAAELVSEKGEAAFADFAMVDSRWQQGERYIFVLDLAGDMLVHPDPVLRTRNQLDLEDIAGKPVIRGLLDAATELPARPEGWYHYQWPVPGGLLPRWKSSYVRLVEAPSGKSYVVGSGMYNDRMERPFVVDLVNHAVAEIEHRGEAAFQLFRDPKGRFIAKDAYVFVVDMNGVDLVNPAFPNLEGRNLLDLKDIEGRQLIRDMLDLIRTDGSGWVDYLWPKPGESVSTRKSAHVSLARLAGKPVMVGCGTYLADAPKAARVKQMTAGELMALVREGAALLEQEGEQAYPEFRTRGSKWFRYNTYFFVWTTDGIRTFQAPEPALEGQDVRGLKDIAGRPIGEMILGVGTGPTGEGWVHYMYPEPGDIFPAWKSTFLKRVTFPSGKQHILGCGIYHMQMDRVLVEDLVDRAAALLAEKGKEAFGQLRDKTGPFVFMDTYVFVHSMNGTELVNPAQPSLEGRNLMDLKDVRGKAVVREQITAVTQDASAWLECHWYRPG